MTAPLDKCFAPAQLNGLSLRNRVLKAATFEGMTPGGIPSEELIAFHRSIAEGGTAMTTVGYCTVEPDGRISDQMLFMHEGIRSGLERLVDAVHDAGGAASGQMGHCGNFTKNRSLQRKRPLGPSRGINPLGLAYGLPFAGAMNQQHIDQMVDDYGDAAKFMKSVGFDALEIHFGHGYGLSQFISPKTNRRTDAYGGSLANRMRLPLRVLEAVRTAVGDSFPLLGKMGLTDGVKGGLMEDEAVEVAALLDRGGIDALIPSGGTSSMNPMWLFRGDSILPGMLEVERNRIMRLGLRVMGKRMIRSYPYEELYFLDGARRVRDRVDCKLVYIGGVSTIESLEAVMREFDFVQLGRALLKDPALVRNATANALYRNGCNHCNRCATLIDHPDGIRCVLNDGVISPSGITQGAALATR
jgi:2,4-dienoyl-CoA reductase-like NADH-dependent reductase (Old Yellow Enzyme family)